MNDVLPKPFTKEGLLNMLEKHLGHLKKGPEGIDALPPPTAQSMAQSSTAQSLKEESSPGESPSTITTWHSPNQFTGVSPTVPNHYMQSVHQPPTYGMDHSPLQYQPPPPQTPLAAPARQNQQQHRRQVSDMTGGDDVSNDAKRQRVFVQNPSAMSQMPRRPG